jgi:hypothetical protein
MEQMLWQPFTAESRKRQIEKDGKERISTYRKGTKWLRPELVGQRVELVDQTDNSVFATAEVISVKAVKFKDLDTIDHWRQSSDMTEEARLGIMQKVYGEYDEDTLTTVVTLGNIDDFKSA